MPSKSFRRSDTSYTNLADLESVKTAIADSRVDQLAKKDDKKAE